MIASTIGPSMANVVGPTFGPHHCSHNSISPTIGPQNCDHKVPVSVIRVHTGPHYLDALFQVHCVNMYSLCSIYELCWHLHH